jgi:uncharacterized membrane protein YraQ (UPF0718 family)
MVVLDILINAWAVATQMAPSLLLGFLIAGLLSVVISSDLVETHLGGRSIWQVCKAALLGVPLPLCSCSVLPVAASLRRHGASRGSTVSFLVSTPQTGVDSIFATQALLGPVFVVFRVVVAFVSGILSGTLVEFLSRDGGGALDAAHDGNQCQSKAGESRLVQALRYGFVTLSKDIGRPLLLGILLSGVLTVLVPEDSLSGRMGSGIASMFVMMLIGIPVYVCSTGSIPVAFAFVSIGVSPGAALVFLISGPATNAAALSMVWKDLGRTATVIYLAVIAACALAAGLVMDRFFAGSTLSGPLHEHSEGVGLLSTICAIVLMALLVPSLLPRKKKCH